MKSDVVITQAMVDAIVKRAQQSDYGLDAPDKGPDSYNISMYGANNITALGMLLINAHFSKYDLISIVTAALEEVALHCQHSNKGNDVT